MTSRFEPGNSTIERSIGPSTLALLVAINGLVLLNAVLHDPRVNWDGSQHGAYIRSLANGRLPSPSDSREFFSPPLPYLVPAAVHAAATSAGADERLSLGLSIKAGQLLNVVLSVVLTVSIVRLCQVLAPGIRSVPFTALALLGLLPVFFKTFALQRGEPFVAALTAVILHHAVRALRENDLTASAATRLGILCGAIVLARQWGFFVLAALVLWSAWVAARRPPLRARVLRCAFTAAIVAALIGGPFYVRSWLRFGSPMAFNRAPSALSSLDRPFEYVFGLDRHDLFSRPVRPAFGGRILPIFYSEIWGDYIGYWTIWGLAPDERYYLYGFHLAGALERREREPFRTNYDSTAHYLGRVNAAALLPAALFFVSVATAIRGKRIDDARSSAAADADQLPAFVVFVSLLGYLAFVLLFPNPSGDTVKAGYVLHVFPISAVLASRFLEELRGRSRRRYTALVGLLVVAGLHNAPMLVTRYWIIPG